jgi:hypothetical protein
MLNTQEVHRPDAHRAKENNRNQSKNKPLKNHFSSRDEWVVGYGASFGGGVSREYIVHTRFPRFIARIVLLSEGENGKPKDVELPVDTKLGSVYKIDDNMLLCEVVWMESPDSLARKNVSPKAVLAQAAEVVLSMDD